MTTRLERLIDERLPQHTLTTYEARTEAAVRVLSRICGMDAEREVHRLNLVREHLGRRVAAAGPGSDTMGALHQRILQHMPTSLEMVLTLANGVPRGFAYLTQGSAAASLPEALTNLLRGVLELFLASNGSAEAAAQIADVFRVAFPNVAGLADFSPLAQGLLVGVVPRGDSIELKLYFNTRLDTSVPHRQKVLDLLSMSGIEDKDHGTRVYDALYQSGMKFSGVGIDLADADGRVKLYVHAPRITTVPFVEALIGQGIAQGPVAHAQKLIDMTASPSSSNDCEVAFALRGSGPTTLKITCFNSGSTAGRDDGDKLAALLADWGYAAEPVRELIAALHVPDAVIQKYPLHGVGVELTEATVPKVNVYVKADI